MNIQPGKSYTLRTVVKEKWIPHARSHNSLVGIVKRKELTCTVTYGERMRTHQAANSVRYLIRGEDIIIYLKDYYRDVLEICNKYEIE